MPCAVGGRAARLFGAATLKSADGAAGGAGSRRSLPDEPVGTAARVDLLPRTRRKRVRRTNVRGRSTSGRRSDARLTSEAETAYFESLRWRP
jgi:hypothetical protein